MSLLRTATEASKRYNVTNNNTARHFSGFQGPGSRGMGKDGGGKGDGGTHRSPRGQTPAKGGAFAEFRAKRVAALQRDIQAAKDATSAEEGGKSPRPSNVKSTRQDTHHRPGRVPHRGGPPKQNFADKVLNPASKGNLSEKEKEEGVVGGGPKKHASGIPKLIHRKPIGHQVHDAEQLNSARPVGQRRSGRASVRGEMSHVQDNLGAIDRFSNVPAPRVPDRERRPRSSYLEQNNLGFEKEWSKLQDYLAINHYAYNCDNQDDDGYDSDADLNMVCGPDDPDYIDVDNHEHVRKVDGKYIFDIDAIIELTPEEQAQSVRDARFVRQDAPQDARPYENCLEYEWYFRDFTNLDDEMLLEPSKPVSNAMLPLKPHGPRIDDFIEASFDHPSRFMTMEKKFVHTDSKREPKPIFPKGRTPPDEKFMNGYKGFLYITGLVPQVDEATGAIKDFGDPLHKNSIAENVAKLFGVSSMDVAPASSTSAFVGFATKLDAKKAMMNCESSLAVKHPTKIEKYDTAEDRMTDDEKEFVAKSSSDKILKVSGLPPGTTSIELFHTLFPPGTKLDAMFGPLEANDYLRVSDTVALINLGSQDLVSKALKASGIANNATVFGQRSMQVQRAKRERVFDGWFGVLRQYAKSKLGNRLFVTGDVPPHDLFLSHNDLMHISGLPPHVTLQDLATFFQPFSADRRDVYGSSHIVRCSQGLPTGTAYVGFELPGEINEVIEMYKGKAMIGGCEVQLTPVQDKLLRRGKREGARPARTLEQLNDDLYNWEKHVDPKDIKELEEKGITKDILDEAMLTLRSSNRSFAGDDQSMPGERIHEQRPVGHLYKSAVRMYIKLLKECAGSKEDPGLMYKAMFAPEQPVDLSIFEYEAERIKALRKRGV